MAPTSSTVAAWALGLRLRERREEAGLSGNQAAKAIGIASAYLSDVEHGKKTVSHERLDVIIEAYEFGPDEGAELHALRDDATQRGWWNKYSALFSSDLLRFFGCEHGAERVFAYDSGVMNGLLQTEGYARAIIEAGAPNLRMAEVERRVQCRMTRQQRITSADPLRLNVVMSEAVLWQQIGGPNVLKSQLEHLLILLEGCSRSLELRVVPFETPGHPATGGSAFHLMTFSSANLPPVVWQESVTSKEFITDAIMVREYSLAYNETLKLALSQEDSIQLVQKAVCQL